MGTPLHFYVVDGTFHVFYIKVKADAAFSGKIVKNLLTLFPSDFANSDIQAQLNNGTADFEIHCGDVKHVIINQVQFRKWFDVRGSFFWLSTW